jgi:hypothetical protein
MSILKTTILFVVALTCMCNNLFAQQCDDNCCSSQAGGQPPSGVMFASSHNKGEWMVSYRYMNMMMSGNLSGSKSIPDQQIFQNYIMSPDKMMMQMHMLMLMYGVSNKLTLMAMLNYNVQSMSMNMFPVSVSQMPGMDMSSNNGQMNGKTSGFGDTKLYAIYKLLNKNKQTILLTASISIPSGSINTTDVSSMNTSNIASYTMQLGSGSFEFLPALSYQKKFGNFSFGAQSAASFRLNDNSANYRLGNEYNVTSWGSYKWCSWLSNSIRAENIYTEQMSGYDHRILFITEPGANPINSGGEQINILAGADFYLTKGLVKRNKFSVEYGIPAYQNFNGIQMQHHALLYVGWQYSF